MPRFNANGVPGVCKSLAARLPASYKLHTPPSRRGSASICVSGGTNTCR